MKLTPKLLVLVLFLISCQDNSEPQPLTEKLPKATFTTLDREPNLYRALDQVGMFIVNSESGRLMTGITEFKTDSILKVLQADSSNYTYTIPIIEVASKKAFRNLIFKRVKNGYFAFVLEYVTDEAMINFHSFSGVVKRYDLEGSLLDEVHLSKAKLTNPSGRTMACFADVTVECVDGGGTSTATGLPLPCFKWVTVITIDCTGGSGGTGGSSGGWNNPGTYVPDPYVGGGSGGSSGGGSTGGTPPTNDPSLEGGGPIGVIPPSSWPGSTNGYPYMWWENDSWLDMNFSLAVDQDYNRLTQAEKDLVKIYPAEAYLISKNVNIATAETVTQFGRNGLNDKSDAFRHSYFQAINTRSVGAVVTKLFSDAHESEVPTQLILEKEMDLFNNQVGIDYAVNTPPRLSLSLIIMDALIRGELRYLSPTLPPPFDQLGNPIPGGDPLFNSTHGITSATCLVPTNQ